MFKSDLNQIRFNDKRADWPLTLSHITITLNLCDRSLKAETIAERYVPRVNERTNLDKSSSRRGSHDDRVIVHCRNDY